MGSGREKMIDEQLITVLMRNTSDAHMFFVIFNAVILRSWDLSDKIERL